MRLALPRPTQGEHQTSTREVANLRSLEKHTESKLGKPFSMISYWVVAVGGLHSMTKQFT